MDMSQYLEIFIDETREHLQSMNQSILQLEETPEDKVLLNEIFRVAHTLKGMAGTMGYTKMAKLTHDMENLLDELRSGRKKVSTEIIDVLFKCFDALESYLDNIVNEENEGKKDYKNLIQTINKIIGNDLDDEVQNKDTKSRKPSKNTKYNTAIMKPDEFETNAIKKAFEMELNVYRITIILNESCVLKSARAFIIFQTLERYSEIIKSQPSVQDIEDERFDFEISVMVISKEEDETFKIELGQIAEISEVDVISIKTIEEADNSFKESEEEKNDLDVEIEEINNEQSKKAKKAKTGKTVRVDIKRLDALMNLVSELIIIKTRLEDFDEFELSQNFNDSIEYLERITTSLHDAVMKARMVPVETVFNRFPRMIRDISKDIGKDISLKMDGEETELDRSVIDEIGDPLIHLLRNSADHGIEKPEERRELGKTPTGHINLRAYQDGNNVIIEVEDDGKGINVEVIKKKIVNKGIISIEAANNLSKQEIIDYLFKPSFSTAEKVTDLSGRGVGLDVVKTKIEALGGVVEVNTELGKGSKFIVRLPLTLAIIQALLVNIGIEKYAIPLSNIQEIVKVKKEDIKIIQKKEVINLRNMLIPVIRLREILEVEKSEEEHKSITIIIVRKGEKLSGFLVDSLIGQQEVVIKSLGKLLSGLRIIAGATILGDGNVALIIDANSLI